MAKALTDGEMAECSLASMLTIGKAELEFICGPMAERTMASGFRANNMEKAST
jgi:hypothetical protein